MLYPGLEVFPSLSLFPSVLGDQPPRPSVADWLIWPREPDLGRAFDPLSGWTQLVLVERHNSPSTWVVTAPTAQMAAFTAGSGCILDRDGVQIASGQATSVEWDQETDTVTVAFASDLVRLGWRIVQPDPAAQLTAAISKFTAAYDLRTGPIEDLILGYTRSNLGDLALPSRQETRLRTPASLGRGGTTQVSARLDNLGVLVQSLAEAGNLRVDIAHAEDADGSWLDMTVEPVADLSDDVRFGDKDSTATGLVRNAQYGLMLPTTTRAVVALGGDLADREFLQLINASAEALWAAAVETVVDQRSIDPTSLEKLAEATRAGQEALAVGAEPRKISFESVLGPDLEYRQDVRVGDIVGYDLPGLAPASDKIREATTTVSVESGQATERVQVVVGTPDAPTSRTQQQTARALRSINQIQRSK